MKKMIRVKLSKKLIAKHIFENLKMEGEDINSYFKKIDSAVNEIRELGNTLMNT